MVAKGLPIGISGMLVFGVVGDLIRPGKVEGNSGIVEFLSNPSE